MRTVFADTFYFLALLDSREERHPEAAQASRDSQLRLVTTEWVLAEFGDAYSNPQDRADFVSLYRCLVNHPRVKIIPATTTLFQRGVNFFEQRTDKEWSLTDCLSFVVMHDEDPSLLVHFDFEQTDLADWRLHNVSSRKNAAPDATIVGCQWVEGRWPDKHALEFRSVSDRVRLSVPGEFEALTITAWVRVQGLDRQFNSLFMSDGFEAGTVHWLIRKDGVLGLTAIGSGFGNYQICASPPVLALDQFGIWLHLAVVLDGNAKRVVQYVNGLPVSEKPLKIDPPFRIGAAELGNWNASGFPDNDPSLIRNFSGAMDEICLFSRAMSAGEIRALYSAGKPQPDPVAALNKN